MMSCETCKFYDRYEHRCELDNKSVDWDDTCPKHYTATSVTEGYDWEPAM